jgi:hypothetical protein
MSIGNLSQQNIASTYQQLVRVLPTGEMFDGNGDPIINLEITASHSDSATYAATASYVINSIVQTTFETSSSFAENAATASYVASTNFAETAATASYVNELSQNLLVNGTIKSTSNIETEGEFIGTLNGTATRALYCDNAGVQVSGDNGQIQYKNGSQLAGVPDLTYNASGLKAKGDFTGTFNINAPEQPGAIASVNAEGQIVENKSPIFQSNATEWKGDVNGTVNLTELGSSSGAGFVIPLNPPTSPVNGSIYLDASTNRLFIYSNGWHFTVLN